MRPETIKLLKQNTGSNILDIGFSNIFMEVSLQAMVTKATIKYWDFTKIKNFGTAKETMDKT